MLAPVQNCEKKNRKQRDQMGCVFRHKHCKLKNLTTEIMFPQVQDQMVDENIARISLKSVVQRLIKLSQGVVYTDFVIFTSCAVYSSALCNEILATLLRKVSCSSVNTSRHFNGPVFDLLQTHVNVTAASPASLVFCFGSFLR